MEDGRMPPISIITCCITGLRPVYINRAKIQSRLMLIVTKGGCGACSDQFVTIPLLKQSSLYEKTIFPVQKNGSIPSNLIQYNTVL